MKDGMGKALRRAFRQDDLLAKIVPRKPGTTSQLMHPVRMALFSRTTFRPCSGLRSLARSADVSAPVAARHLGRMESAGLVESIRLGNKKIFSALGMVEPVDAAIFSLLSEDAPRKALRQVVLGNTPNQRALSRKLRTYQQEAALVLSKLVGAGLLDARKAGREVRYTPSVKLLAIAEAYEKREPEFRARLLSALETDGVVPRVVGRKACSLLVEVDRGETRVQAAFQLHPLCDVLR
jgi:DNA-binding transcriptional ArsR family regulator